MYIREKYRVFDIVLETSPDVTSEALFMAHNHIKDINGVSVEWAPATPQNIRLRFEGHVSAQTIMLDIMDKLSRAGYK